MKMKGVVISGLALLLSVLGARAQTPAEVTRAIERGVKYLKGAQKGNGLWEFPGHEGHVGSVGATAMAALTLLEVGDVESDRELQQCVRKAAAAVRTNTPDLDFTYSVSACIWFLDKLIETNAKHGIAEPERDKKTILELAERLKNGQTAEGGWQYHVPIGKAPAKPDQEDNSNTQFAVLALWTARRHGAGPDEHLKRAETRFRNHQNNADFGWSYVSGAQVNQSTPAMTCSGLIGLAVGHAVRVKKRTTSLKTDKPIGASSKDAGPSGPLVGRDDDVRDEKIKKALEFLSRHMNSEANWGTYTIWSVERVAKIYALKRINGKDWFAWGCGHLVSSQEADGSFPGQYGPVETCFALLFLKQVNLFGDLTDEIRREDQLTIDSSKGTSKGPVAAATANPNLPATPGLNESTAEEIAARIVAQVLKAPADKQPALLTILKETKGKPYTDALVELIPKLSGATQQRAREMLAERLTRMKNDQLRAYMAKDQPAELRRGAASACALKGEPELLLDLMTLMKDADADVAAAAKEAHEKLRKSR